MTPRLAPIAVALCLGAPLLMMGSADGAEAQPSRAARIAEAAEALRPKLVELRRDFHRHPELAYHEERTARLVAEQLRALGFDEVRTNLARHGVVALLKGARPGPVVAVRADLDALPISETNDLPYRSTVPGVMHACGHDAHTAIALGVAEVLSQMRGQLPGSVKFLFQPAEEAGPATEPSGAYLMVRDGALERPRPLAIFALHTAPELEVGTIGYRSRPAQAAITVFALTVRGEAVSGLAPQRRANAILAAAQCVSALQSMQGRRLDAFEPVVLTIGTIHGGDRPFNSPAEVKMGGSFRTFSEEAHSRVTERMREALTGVTAACGVAFDLQFNPATSVVVNNPGLVAESLPSLRRAVGVTNVLEIPRRMGGEDFSCYAQVVPGFLFRLGSSNRAKGITAEAHTPAFDIDEDCLVVGVKAMATVLADFLDRKANER